MAPPRGGCGRKLQALVAGLCAAVASADDGEAAWAQVAQAINQGFCAQSYDKSTVAQTLDDDPQKWVAAHDYYRGCHGSQPVTWDTTLAAYAKNWVEVLLTKCESLEDVKGFVQASGHEPHDPSSYTLQEPKNGENLALFSFPVIQMLPMDETSTVESWYREIDDQCANKGLSAGCEGGLNHFTALVWKSVSYIGCYSGSRGSFKLVSCRYAPGQALEEDFCNLPNAQGDCATRPEDPMVPPLVGGQHCEPHGVIGVNGLPNGGAVDVAGQKVIPLPLLIWGWLQRLFSSHHQGPAPDVELPPNTLPQTMLGDHLAANPEQAAQWPQQAQVQTPQRLFDVGLRPRPAAGGLPLYSPVANGAAVPAAVAALAALAAATCAVAASCRSRNARAAGFLEGRELLAQESTTSSSDS